MENGKTIYVEYHRLILECITAWIAHRSSYAGGITPNDQNDVQNELLELCSSKVKPDKKKAENLLERIKNPRFS